MLSVIYLLFSQSCHATHADVPIRRDLCDEARRLAKMLAAHPVGDVPAVHALLALMCFHAARFDARVALDGGVILFEQQDRSAWKWSDVREGMAWLARSAAGDELTRYHLEAGIAWEHCRAPTFADTDWGRIAQGYEMLDRVAPSPIHALNRTVAEAHLHGPQAGLDRLAAVAPEIVPARYPGWHAVIGELHFRLGRRTTAEKAWHEALHWTTAGPIGSSYDGASRTAGAAPPNSFDLSQRLNTFLTHQARAKPGHGTRKTTCFASGLPSPGPFGYSPASHPPAGRPTP